jgi:hypothetical protein
LRHAGRDLFKEFEILAADIVFDSEEAGGVAVGMRKAGNKASADRIGDEHKYDRHGVGRLQQRRDASGAICQNNVRGECDQLGGILANAIGITPAPTIVDAHVAALGPA